MPSAKPPEPDIILTLRPLANATPAAMRLRGALKVLLRRFGLRCVRIEFADHSEEKREGENG